MTTLDDSIVSARYLWASTLKRLQIELAPAIFTTWFKDTAALSLQGSVLTIRAGTHFTKTQLEGRFVDRIQTIVSEIAKRPIDIRFEVPDTTEYRPVITQTFNPWAETTTVEQLLVLLEAERGVDIVVDALSKKTMTEVETKRLLRDLEGIIEDAKKGIELFGGKNELG